jgi:tRNA threonylcarbamoyl adenosine modification protein YjeE
VAAGTELNAYAAEIADCTRCRLAEGRTQVVFGIGNPEADLMFVGEAPGFHEDKQGYPFVGQAGKLLDQLLGGIGLSREDVYIANVIKCRPPGNRDPMPDEIEACESHLFRQVELIQPKLVGTLGNFATKLLSGKPLGITRVHGQEQEVTLGGRPVLLYPLYHPAAALYTPSMLQVLQEDFSRIPQLIGRVVEPEPEPEPDPLLVAEPAVQLGLFWSRNMELSSSSAEETEGIAAKLAARLGSGDVVTISGELGSGKTTFVRGACRGLGVLGPVTSPTYTIGHRYRGEVDVSHLDLYRFESVSPAEWGDLEPYFDGAVCFVEWPEAAGDALPPVRVRVVLRHDGGNRRLVSLESDEESLLEGVFDNVDPGL